MGFEFAGYTYVTSMLKGHAVEVTVTSYYTKSTYRGVVTTFVSGLTQDVLLVLDDKTIINSRYIVSIDVID